MGSETTIRAHVHLNRETNQDQVDLLEDTLGEELPSYDDGAMFLYAMKEGKDRYIQTTYYATGDDGKNHKYNVTFSTKPPSNKVKESATLNLTTTRNGNGISIGLGPQRKHVHNINYQVTEAQLNSAMLLLAVMDEKRSALFVGLDMFIN